MQWYHKGRGWDMFDERPKIVCCTGSVCVIKECSIGWCTGISTGEKLQALTKLVRCQLDNFQLWVIGHGSYRETNAITSCFSILLCNILGKYFPIYINNNDNVNQKSISVIIIKIIAQYSSQYYLYVSKRYFLFDILATGTLGQRSNIPN